MDKKEREIEMKRREEEGEMEELTTRCVSVLLSPISGKRSIRACTMLPL